MDNLLDSFHLLRPWWLLALLPLGLLLRRWWGQQRTSRSWQAVCDARLLPFLLQGTEQQRARWPYALAALAALLAVIALAGPSWERVERPVLRNEAALVVLLDLSRSMDATDLKPSRLTRARLKLLDILQRREEGQTALIAFAAQPYTVSPLTVDADTIAAQVPVLESGLMPSQGSRLDLALSAALELLKRGNAPVGEVLLIGDGLRAEDARIDAALEALRDAGYRLSVLGVGTPDGGPIAIGGGGFLKDVHGQIVIPRLDRDALAGLAAQGGGRFALLAADDRDIDHLFAASDELTRALDEGERMSSSDEWVDAGIWLVPLLLPVALLLFRRGVLWGLLALVLLQQPNPAEAWSWDELWQTRDQRAAEAFSAGDYPAARRLFDDPAWRATSAYREHDYPTAAREWGRLDSADAHYNRGNALALDGKLSEALEAYDAALERDPDHAHARINKEMVEAKLKELAEQQKEQQQQEPQSGEQEGEPSSEQNEPGDSGQGQAPGDSGEPSGDSGESSGEQGGGEQQGAPEGEAGDAQQSEQAQSAEAGDDTASEAEGEQMQPKAGEGEPGDQADGEHALSELDEADQLRQQQLRAIPDDPGGLLRRKFEHLYKRFNSGADEADPW